MIIVIKSRGIEDLDANNFEEGDNRNDVMITSAGMSTVGATITFGKLNLSKSTK